MRDPFFIIKTPRITEKATSLSALNQYVFRVALDATKIEIKHAVKTIFKKEVKGVNTMRVEGKKKRSRTIHAGKTSDWKKAIVTLKDGEKIDFV
ncbi:MAG: 50S ribosomal protein L23 [Candidatus Methylacidiphilales bacterium]|nr:50S ribosomal protein L23 [Candidatus Methylacidiphilales bacterium]